MKHKFLNDENVVAQAINELKEAFARQGTTRTILTANEAREMLGMSKAQLYRLSSNRLIPHYKPTGKLLYFKREELEQWISDARHQTLDELNTEAANYLINKKGGSRNG